MPDILIGGGLCALGVVLTIGTYSMASGRGGGTYLIAWGPAIFGLLRLARGLSNLSSR